MPIATGQRFSSVWDAIEDTPRTAASLRIRSNLMLRLTEVIQLLGMTEVEAAAHFGVTQPRIVDLMCGKVGAFSIDALIGMAAMAGMAPTVKLNIPKITGPCIGAQPNEQKDR
jgi:predicted XRE-type DNA-binding protein